MIEIADDLLQADLYLPEKEPDTPLIIGFHGGGWRRGDKANLKHWGEFFAQNGFGFLSCAYHLSDKGAVWPQNIIDAQNAFLWVEKNQSKYGFLPEKSCALGASAGAHLAALAFMNPQGQKWSVKCEFLEKMPNLIGIYGPYDLARHWLCDEAKGQNCEGDPSEQMLGFSYRQNPAIYAEASPITHIADLKKNANILLLHGDADEAIDISQSRNFAHALNNAGKNAVFAAINGASHYWFSNSDPQDKNSFSAIAAPLILDFCKKYIGN